MLSGELKAGAVAGVFEEVAAGEMSGVLQIVSGKNQWELLFRDGALVGARKKGVNTAERVVDLLLEGGVLRQETVRDAIKKQSKVMKSCLEILMEEGHVPLILYSRILSATLRLYLLDTIALSKGHYEFAVKEDLREETGAKPLDIAQFNAFRDHFDNDRRMLARLQSALFTSVTVPGGRSFPLDRKSLFYSYSTQDRDLFDFLVRMSMLVKEGVLIIDRGLSGIGSRQLVAVLVLRAIAFLLVAFLLVIVLVVEPPEGTTASGATARAARYKVALLKEMLRFETDEPVDAERLQRGGYITIEELRLWHDAEDHE